MNTHVKGAVGEGLAQDYLNSKGYEIIKNNFRFGKIAEIDIVAKDGDVLVFVEVKSVRNHEYGTALDKITPGKVVKLRKAAEAYLYINKIENQDCRFDVVGIDYSSGKPEITHLQNAF